MMNRLFLVGVVLFAAGCATPPPPTPPQHNRIVVIHYYPYTVSFVRTVARPEPDYKDWDEARMVRDLKRLSDLGVDVVMVSINPDDMHNEDRTKAYIHFVDLAAKYSLNVALMLEAHNAEAADVVYFGLWVQESFAGRCGYLHVDGLPFIELYDARDGDSYCDGRVFVRHTIESKEWYWSVSKEDRPGLSKNGEQAMAFAGFLVNGDKPELGFSLSRENGERLRRQFRAAAATNAKFICVASYNDFWEGHFIEPNSLDGEVPYRVLKQEIQRLRESDHVAAVPVTAPAPL
jgi:hypothetical protein